MDFVLAVELGMKPEDALRAGTIVAAEVLGIAKDAGSLDVGKRANLIAVLGEPLDDISTLRQPHLVVKEGSIAFKRA